MKMKKVLAFALCVGLITPALAQRSHSVRGYTRKDGTYVAPHRQTNPNSTRNDNWSTRGNVNPYTGREGDKPRDNSTYSPSATSTSKPY